MIGSIRIKCEAAAAPNCLFFCINASEKWLIINYRPIVAETKK